MGVCCLVFDIDGMLFEFFMNFLNIEKVRIFFRTNSKKSIACLSHSFSRYMLFSTLHFFFGGGEILKSSPSLTGRWFRRWFLQIVDRDSVNLYPIYPLFPCSGYLSQVCVCGGGLFS